MRTAQTRRSFLLSACASAALTGKDSEVSLKRLPALALQPQSAPGGLLYFQGAEALAGDVFYARSGSAALRVNTHAGSSIAAGNVRGPHVAAGRNGLIHAAWNGSKEGKPKGPGGAAPMLYTRLNEAGTAFEPERNVIQSAYGLDGGGAVAADALGNVYVFWHAPTPGKQGEGNRRIWLARSVDDGKSFSDEKAATDKATGACGCCGMAAFADSKGNVYALYRSAFETVHRDMYLLTSNDRGKTFRTQKVDEWQVGACVMSTAAFCESPEGVIAAWETKGQIRFARIDARTGAAGEAQACPGEARGRKHPALAAGPNGDLLVAWTEGTGWKRGGNLAWQVFDRNGRVKGERGQTPGVPAFSFAAASARPDGGFTLVY